MFMDSSCCKHYRSWYIIIFSTCIDASRMGEGSLTSSRSMVFKSTVNNQEVRLSNRTASNTIHMISYSNRTLETASIESTIGSHP